MNAKHLQLILLIIICIHRPTHHNGQTVCAICILVWLPALRQTELSSIEKKNKKWHQKRWRWVEQGGPGEQCPGSSWSYTDPAGGSEGVCNTVKSRLCMPSILKDNQGSSTSCKSEIFLLKLKHSFIVHKLSYWCALLDTLYNIIRYARWPRRVISIASFVLSKH